MKKRNTTEFNEADFDDEEEELNREMLRLQANLKRIEDQFSGKIGKLKQLNKAQSERNVKLMKEMIELKKGTQIQKQQIEKIVLNMVEEVKLSTPKLLKKMSKEEQRNSAGSPSNKAYGINQKFGYKKGENTEKRPEEDANKKIRRSIQLKKMSPRGSPNKEPSSFEKVQSEEIKNKYKVLAKNSFRQSVHIFK